MVNSLTYADVFQPSGKVRVGIYDAALILAGSMLIGFCAQLAVWLPFSPVPVTGQTFAVLLTGVLLGARRGSLCVLAYLLQGAAGLPVFASARAGLAVLLGPTGGYLIGFIAAAWLTGYLAQKGWDRKAGTTVLAMALGNAVIYAFGVLWLGLFTGSIKAAAAAGVYPFVIADCFKIAVAAVILPSGWKILRKFEGFRSV